MVGKPFIAKRRLQSTKTSYVISIPSEWFKNNRIDPQKVESLTLVGNEDLVVLNPNGKVIRELTERLIKKNITLEQLERIIEKEVVF